MVDNFVAPRDPEDLWREMAGNFRAHVSKPPKSFPGGGRVGGGVTIYCIVQSRGYNGHEKMILIHIILLLYNPGSVRGFIGGGKTFRGDIRKVCGPRVISSN